MLNRAMTGLASRPPAADSTPDRPAGIRSVNRVEGGSGLSGVNVSRGPFGCQYPATRGESVGYAELRATGPET